VHGTFQIHTGPTDLPRACDLLIFSHGAICTAEIGFGLLIGIQDFLLFEAIKNIMRPHC
jgi:hypothetical protein